MPLILEKHIDKGLLLLWELTEDLEWFKNQFPHLVDDDTFKQLRNEKRQKEWLAVKMMLKHLGCTDLNHFYNEAGQPQLHHPKFKKISISHSSQLAGILIHPNQEVGLDLESLDRNFKSIERKYLSPKEIELAQKTAENYALFWCAKEAVYKTAGIPGISFSTQILLELNQQNKLTAKLLTPELTKTYEISYFEYKNQLVVYLLANNKS